MHNRDTYLVGLGPQAYISSVLQYGESGYGLQTEYTLSSYLYIKKAPYETVTTTEISL